MFTLHWQIPNALLNTNLGRTRVTFTHACAVSSNATKFDGWTHEYTFRFDYEYKFDYEYELLETFRFDYEYEVDYEYDFIETFRFDYEYVHEFD